MRTADICPFNPIEPGDLKELIAKVDSGRLVMIFAEGRITENGGLMKIYEAPGLVADKSKALYSDLDQRPAIWLLLQNQRKITASSAAQN